MFSKINILAIFSDHIDTLSNETPNGPPEKSVFDFFIFLIVPFLVGAASVYFELPASAAVAELSVTVLSIASGLMFNVLVLTYGILEKGTRPDAAPALNNRRLRLLKYLYANISFSILASLAGIPFSLGLALWPGHSLTVGLFRFFGVSIHLLVAGTVVLGLKRWHTLMTLQFSVNEDMHQSTSK
jgi:hypothetical protein